MRFCSSIRRTSADIWRVLPSLNVARFRLASVMLSDGRVLATGGQGGASNSVLQSAAEIYGPLAATWTLLDAGLQFPRAGQSKC